MTRQILENSRHFHGALLMVANAKALFQLADSLDHAERYYFTLKNQDHDDVCQPGDLTPIARKRGKARRSRFAK